MLFESNLGSPILMQLDFAERNLKKNYELFSDFRLTCKLALRQKCQNLCHWYLY